MPMYCSKTNPRNYYEWYKSGKETKNWANNLY